MMATTTITPRDEHRRLREALTDGVEGIEAEDGDLKLENGGDQLTLSGSPGLVAKAIGEAKVHTNGDREMERVLDAITQRISRASSRHGPHADADTVTVQIASSPNRLSLEFSRLNGEQRR